MARKNNSKPAGLSSKHTSNHCGKMDIKRKAELTRRVAVMKRSMNLPELFKKWIVKNSKNSFEVVIPMHELRDVCEEITRLFL